MEKNKKNSRLNQKSFYFEDYSYNSQNEFKNNRLNINEDRIYSLFFIFFCLIIIFAIKIFLTSLQEPFSKLEAQ